MKNNWTNIVPPIADHPSLKYSVKFLVRIKPLSPDHPAYTHLDHYGRTGVFRTCLAMELGGFKASGLPFEWQPLEESGAFDDEPEASELKSKFHEQRKLLLDTKDRITQLSEDLQTLAVDLGLSTL